MMGSDGISGYFPKSHDRLKVLKIRLGLERATWRVIKWC